LGRQVPFEHLAIDKGENGLRGDAFADLGGGWLGCGDII
jgi:hypothetical protein